MARRTRQISLKECYDILRLQKGADLQAVKSAYRRRAFELHPDLHPGDPEASRQFQLLNEAYVALSAMLKPAEEARQKAEKTKTSQSGSKAEAGGARQHAEASQSQATSSGGAANAADREASRAGAAYAEQDVLRDLLNDPFARRVFEDIYSELANKQQKNTQQARQTPPPPEPEKGTPPPKEPQKQVKPLPLWERGQEKGVKGAVKDWLRKQIDDEQSLTIPAAKLRPGCKIRLQIRKGMSEEVSSVDVTLPKDFVVGKPMRLRGLGKRVGPWQGDLYLTIYTE